MYHASEGDAGSTTSLECFSSQIAFPSPESFTDDTLEHMGAKAKNKLTKYVALNLF